MIKPAIVFSSIIFFILTGLTFIATGFISTKNVSPVHLTSKDITETKISDSNFVNLEFSLFNSTSVAGLSDSIDQFTGNFEKNYLLALLDLRRFDYAASFNRLFSLLPMLPEYYPFYDQIIFTAKASGNTKLLAKFISNNKSINNFSDYLRALVHYNENKYSDAIKLLENKIEFEELYLLSYCYRGLGHYDNALKIMDNAERLLKSDDVKLSKVYVSKGSLYLLSGNSDEAEKFYKKGFKYKKGFNY